MAGSNWQQFFDGFAPQYMGVPFVTNTVAEVDFVLEETGITPGSRVLDVGCGTGRHAVELAKRGYRVTGVDLSPCMLAEARTADEAGVEVELVHSNAAEYRSDAVFDAFDPLTMTRNTAVTVDAPEGTRAITVRQHGYAPLELALMARLAGFEVAHLGGGTAGNWGHRPLDLDEMEIMLVARKPSGGLPQISPQRTQRNTEVRQRI